MKDTLKKNFALTLIILIGILIGYMLLDFLKPIIAAVILSFLFYPLYNYIYNKTNRKVLSAFLVIIILILIIFMPLSTIAGIILNQVNDININPNSITNFETMLSEITNKNISLENGLVQIQNLIKTEFSNILSKIISITSNFLFSSFIMFFVMFYLLTDKKLFIKTAIYFIPFSKINSKHLLDESSKVTKAILIGQVLTAIVQGLLGMAAFFIAGIDNAFLWGIIMIILSIIPMIGAFLIWVPAGIYLLVTQEVGMGIFVLVWGFLVISQIDNIIRPKLVGKFADIHPLETFLGIFMGLSFFGIIGIVIGPLIISLFSTLIKTYKKEYSISS